jgi:N-acetylmuramic acid 6-phosphate etherase
MEGECRGLATEQVLPGLADLDRRPTLELVELLNDADASVPAAVRTAAGAIAALADAIAASLSAGGRLLYVGAGSAGAIAALDAFECGPTFGCRPGEVVALVAGQGAVEEGSGLRWSAGDAEDDAAAGEADLLATGCSPADAVVGVSASGRTPYVLGALATAHRIGACTGGVSCNVGSELSKLVQHPVELASGPELIAGSTRLKATTAQKLVLNTLSTIVMMRLGRTVGPHMVAMRVENDKLRRRARAMLAELTGAGEEAVAATLGASGDDVRVALIVLLTGCNPASAAHSLRRCGGDVRAALAAVAAQPDRAHPFTAPEASPETTFR